MTNRLICDIYFFLYIRFVFGFYHEFKSSRRVRWLARCYCFFVCANLNIWMYKFFNEMYSFLPTLLTTFEYLSYVLISLWKDNHYLLRFYTKIPFIDDVTNNEYKSMRLYFIGYITTLILIKLAGFVKYLVLYSFFGEGRQFFAFLEFCAWSANFIGRLPALFVFALLYSRVKSMRKTLESCEFQCRCQGKHHPRRYIQMYEALLNTLEKCDCPMKLQLLGSIVFPTMFFAYELLFNLEYIRSDTVEWSTFDLLWFTLEFVTGCSPLIVIIILCDMICMEAQKMLVITVKRRIDSKNERDRGEIQKMVQLLKERPFQFSLWRVIPLNLRSMLSLLTFCITTIIAILQIEDWFK